MFSNCRTRWFLKKNCPQIWALLNDNAKRNPPKGIIEFISGKWGSEGRKQLRVADMKMSSLIGKTSATTVTHAYSRDLSGVDTEHQMAELLCEVALVDAISGIFSTSPVLRPKTRNGRHCDMKIIVDSGDLYGEVKRFRDTWEGRGRSIAKSPPGEEPPDTVRPRSMDLVSKLKNVYTQFPEGTLNVLFVFHPSVWNSHVYVKQALFGDASGFDVSHEPILQDDGLFALDEWREVSACTHSRVNSVGSFSIVQSWRNPNANVSLPDSVRERLVVHG